MSWKTYLSKGCCIKSKPDYCSLPDRLVCENCKSIFQKLKIKQGYGVDLKVWCHGCRVGKNHVSQKCKCEERGCYCAVGFPFELLCLKCRDDRYPGDVHLFCVCPPPEEIFDRWQVDDDDENELSGISG